jgi:16S rRNA (guanine527-N7)-methyltransferase
VERVGEYVDLLLKANRSTNLVSRRIGRRDLEALAYGASRALEVVGLDPVGTLLDIGSGAGLPGIPIAIRHPELAVVLNEARRRRINALCTFVSVLGLANCTVLPGELKPNGTVGGVPVHCNIATAFGIAKPPQALELVASVLLPGGAGIISAPRRPGKADFARWLLHGAALDLTVTLHEDVLAGPTPRSVLVARRPEGRAVPT